MQNEQQLLFLLFKFIVNKSYYHFEFSHSAFHVLFGMLNGGKSLKCLLLFSSVGRCLAAHAIQRRRVESTTTKNKCSLSPGAAQLETIGVLQDNQDKSHQSTDREGSMETGDKDMGLGVLYIISTLSHTAAYHIFFVIFSKLFTSRNFTNRGGKVV